MSRHRLVLAKELIRTRNRAVHELLGQEIVKLSNVMGLPALELDVIGIAEPTKPGILADFWAAVLHLNDKGNPYDHSRSHDLIALNLPHLVELFVTNGLQPVIEPVLSAALKTWQAAGVH